jgi:RNA polymerase sigma factor (sigma-70 family)
LKTNAHERFWALWQRHSHYLFSQSLRLMNGNRVDAEDAFSAAMLRACETFPRHASSIVNEKAWLGKVLHNICVDVYRSRQRHQDVPFPLEDEESERDGHMPCAPSPEVALLRGELRSHLRRNILALPSPLRDPAVMRLLQNMPYDDIASHLGLTNCNVRKRIQLAYSILRVTLGSGWQDTWSGRTKRLVKRDFWSRRSERW